MMGFRCNEGSANRCDFCRKETKPEYALSISLPGHVSVKESVIVCSSCVVEALTNSLINSKYPDEVALELAERHDLAAILKSGNWVLVDKKNEAL